MKLSKAVEIARQTDEQAFVTCYPHAMLVIRKRSTESEQFETDLDWRSRTKKSAVEGWKADDGSLSGLIEPLVKTERNPYAAMITVGRSPNNDVCIAVGSVSKLHAYFQRDGERWTLRDSMSSYGTFVNGVRVSADAAVPVADGTHIGFGPETDCIFLLPPALWSWLKQRSS